MNLAARDPRKGVPAEPPAANLRTCKNWFTNVCMRVGVTDDHEASSREQCGRKQEKRRTPPERTRSIIWA